MPSKIEWTDETWNPVTGCTKISAGCKHCYAERMFPRLYGRQYVELLAAQGAPGEVCQVRRKFTDVRCHPERLDAPLHWRKPRMVFVNSMSDLFHDDVPAAFIGDVFWTMEKTPRHTFQVLTKRPDRMRRIVRDLYPNGAPPNVWLGVSVEDQATADERIPILLGTPAAVRWVSAEPLLGPVDFSPWLRRGDDDLRDFDPLAYGLLQMGVESGNAWVRPALDWIVAGGESGPGARPMHSDWPRAIRDQCAASGVPYFFKQWGEWIPQNEILGLHSSDDIMTRVGKKRAGHLLDGREHREFPTPPGGDHD